MADDETKTSGTPDNAAKAPNKKRRLKAAPVTVREQSELATAKSKSARPSKRGVVGRVISAPFRLIGRVILRPLGRFKFFRIIGYILYPPYFRNAVKELRLVTWPDTRQTRRLTFAVIVFSVIFGVIVAVVDYGLDKLFRALILKN